MNGVWIATVLASSLNVVTVSRFAAARLMLSFQVAVDLGRSTVPGSAAMGRRLATCLVTAALLVGSLAAFADAGAGPTATASGKRTYAKFAFGRQYKPRTFRFGMSGFVTSMSWSKWGKKIARGRGTYQFNNCVPDCASGTIAPTRASVVLTGREPCGGRFIFRHFKLYYAGHKTSGPSFCKK